MMPPTIQPADPTDQPAILVLMREFYAEHQLPFDDAKTPRALAQLLAAPALGGAYLIIAPSKRAPGVSTRPAGGDSAADAAAGYFLLTNAFSVEFGGRFLLLDELYVRGKYRGRGFGGAAVDWAMALAADRRAAIRLEVEVANHEATSLYRRRGFTVHETRRLMTLAPPAENGPFQRAPA